MGIFDLWGKKSREATPTGKMPDLLETLAGKCIPSERVRHIDELEKGAETWIEKSLRVPRSHVSLGCKVLNLISNLHTLVGDWIDDPRSTGEGLDISLPWLDSATEQAIIKRALREVVQAADSHPELFLDQGLVPTGDLSRNLAIEQIDLARMVCVGSIDLDKQWNDYKTARVLRDKVAGEVLAEWKGAIRPVFMHSAEALRRAIPEKLLAHDQTQVERPARFIGTIAWNNPWMPNPVGQVIQSALLLANTGVMERVVAAASVSSPFQAEQLLVHTGLLIPQTALTLKDRDFSLLTRLLASTEADRILPLLETLINQPMKADLAVRLKSWGVGDSSTCFSNFALHYADRTISDLEGQRTYLELVHTISREKVGMRPVVVSLMALTETLDDAGLLETAVSLLRSRHNPEEIWNRIVSTGAAVVAGNLALAAQLLNGSNILQKQETPPHETEAKHQIAIPRVPALDRVKIKIRGNGGSLAQLDLLLAQDDSVIARSLRALDGYSVDVAVKAIDFLTTYVSNKRARLLIDPPRTFANLLRFLDEGRHADLERLHTWLQGKTVEPSFIAEIRGAPAKEEQKKNSLPIVVADSDTKSMIFVPSGNYKRLVIFGGSYTEQKQSEVEQSAPNIKVVFHSPDKRVSSFDSSLTVHDLVVVNITKSSHSSTGALIGACRKKGIAWVVLPFSGKDQLINIARRITEMES